MYIIQLRTYPDGDRERDRDLDGLLDPELREGLLLRETLRDLSPMLPASLAPVISLDMYPLRYILIDTSLYQRNHYLLNPTY